MRRSIDDNAGAILDEARKKAEEVKAHLTENARKEVDGLKAAWTSTLSSEKEAFLNTLKSMAGQQVQETLRRILADLSGVSLEERIILSFMENMGNADSMTLEMLSNADEEDGITVRTSFNVEPELESRLVGYLRTFVPENVPLVHETVIDEIAGIELISKGKKISWSIGDYLNDLKERFSQAIREDIPDAPEVLTS
jgi:F-type H+-transporting ATPase subunit b